MMKLKGMQKCKKNFKLFLGNKNKTGKSLNLNLFCKIPRIFKKSVKFLQVIIIIVSDNQFIHSPRYNWGIMIINTQQHFFICGCLCLWVFAIVYFVISWNIFFSYSLLEPASRDKRKRLLVSSRNNFFNLRLSHSLSFLYIAHMAHT